jgi:GT2 family glycosyltransferase
VTEPRVAVVIVNYNTREHLRACLESVRPEDPVDLIVVDNASTDGSQEMVREHFSEVSLLANEDNPGFGAAANQGVRASSAPFALILNSDTRLESGALGVFADYLESHPRAAVVGPHLVFPDLRHQPSTYPRLTPFNTLVLNTYLLDVVRMIPGLRNRYASIWSPTPPGPVAWVKGAAMAVRRTAFDEVSGFDEEYFMYSEEVDLCHRLETAGWEIHFTPGTRVIHVEGASTSTRHEEMSVRLFESMDLFYRRHWSDGQRFRLRIVVAIVALQRILRSGISYVRNREPEHRLRIRRDWRIWIRILRKQFT